MSPLAMWCRRRCARPITSLNMKTSARPNSKSNVGQGMYNGCPNENLNLSRGVLPETLRRGPYAVVDERCEDTTMDSTMQDLLQRHFLLLFSTLVWRIYFSATFCFFLDPSKEDLLQRHFLLLFGPQYRGFTTAPLFASILDPSIYVVQLYEIVGVG